jgi:hypothetical protein
MADTCKVFQAAGQPKPPKRLTLNGEKTAKVESAQHIIEFPGGALELSRLDNGEYWAHLIVNRDDVVDDTDGRVSAFGIVTDSRIDYEYPADPCVVSVPNAGAIRQIALRIRPSAKK